MGYMDAHAFRAHRAAFVRFGHRAERASGSHLRTEWSLCRIRVEPNFLILSLGTGEPPICKARYRLSPCWILQDFISYQMTRHFFLHVALECARAARSLNVPKATLAFSVPNVKLGTSSSEERVRLSAPTSAIQLLSQYSASLPL